MQRVTLTRVFISDKTKDGKPIEVRTKNGPKNATRVAIQTKETGADWVSALAFAGEEAILGLKEGQTVDLVITEKNGYKNFRMPSKLDQLEARVEALEKKANKDFQKETKGYVYPEAGEDGEINPDDVPF